MKSTTRAILFGSIALAAVGASVAAWNSSRGVRVYTDGSTIREPADQAQLRAILWQPPALLGEAINSGGDNYEPRITADGMSLYFARGKPGSNADIYFCQRTSTGVWSDPQSLTAINTPDDELGPELTPDGQTLYFYSNRAGGHGGYDLWRSARTSKGWSKPENLGAEINTSWNEYNPAISPDGLTLLFASNRPRPGENTEPVSEMWPATVRERATHHDYDLYSAPLSKGDIGAPESMSALNTSANEGAPAISPAGDFIYFCSDRPGGQGGFDLYRSRFLRGEYLPPENLGASVNTPDNDLDPALSMGGFALHFSSDRAPASPVDAMKHYAIYSTSSREVFAERETVRSSIDWRSILAAVLPNLIWLLLGLLALLWFLRLARSGRLKTLSLLARCLLLSLVAHVLLMMLFMIWGVTVGLADAIHRGGAMKISFSSGTGGKGQEIASQIQSPFTNVALKPSIVTADRAIRDTPMETAALKPTHLRQEKQSIAVTELAMPRVDPIDAPAQKNAVALAALAEIPVDPPRVSATRIPAAAKTSATNEAQLSTPAVNTQVARLRHADAMDAATPVANAPTVLPTDRIKIEQAAGGSMASISAVNDAQPSPSTPNAPALVATDSPPLVAASSSIALPLADPTNAKPSSEPALVVSSASATGASAIRQSTAAESTQAAATPSVQFAPTSSPNTGSSSTSLAIPTGDVVADATPGPTSALGATDPLVIAGEMPGSPIPLGNLRTPDETRGAAGAPSSHNEPSSDALASAGPSIPSASRVETSPGSDTSPTCGIASTLNPSATTNIGDQKSLAAGVSIGDAIPSPTSDSRNLVAMDSSASSIPLLPPLGSELHLPSEVAPPVDAYKQRAAPNRLEIVKEKGGSEATEQAVNLALKWLAAHQSADGRWDADHFDDQCRHCGGPAKFDADVATTGLALLCFLAADHTQSKDGPYRDVVQRGLAWLKSQQKSDGDLRGNETMYSHGIASIALSEAYGMTRDESLRESVERAIRFITRARDSSGRSAPVNAGGWRYEPDQAGDTSVFGWQVMALTSAKRAGIEIPADVFDASLHWLEQVCPPNNPGLYAYQPGERFTPAMTAEGMFAQQLLGRRRDEARMQKSAEFITRSLPNWRVEPNTYYWYYATLALFQHQGPAWEKWNAAITQQLLENQNTSGAKAGSWDPLDRWSKIGGRVYQTAICTLCLEVYYRYLPLYGQADSQN